MPFIQHNGKRVLFVHIPKTGGTSLEKYMASFSPLRLFSHGVPHVSKCTPQHYRAQDIKSLMGDGFFDYSLAIVRNPYDRIESEYRMRAQIANEQFFKGLLRFSEWVENFLERQKTERFLLDNHLRPQWEFVSKDVEIFKLEDGLSAPLAAVARVLGEEPPADIPHELATRGDRVDWDNADRIRVQNHYAKDFETFGYQP